MTPPELSRPLRVDTLGPAPRAMPIRADESERAALVARFGLEALDLLEAEVAVTRSDEKIVATGRLRAEVTQACVATGEGVAQSIDEPFTILFVPEPAGAGADEEIELTEAEMDVVFYDGAMIDIGEAMAETLSLGLDPYPRAPAADAALREAGVKSEEEAGPFGALAVLRDKLKGD